MKPIRVLHCIHSLSGGGAERQLTLLTNHLDGVALEFGIFCVNDINHNINTGSCELYPLVDMGDYPWRLIKCIREAILKFKPDVLHLWLPPSIVIPGLVAAKLHGLPVTVSFRNARDFATWKDFAECVSAWLLADAVVSNNHPDQSNIFFRHLYSRKKHDHIPNAVSVAPDFINSRAVRNANPLFTLLFVGRLVDSKNWQLLLDAVANMRNVKPWKLLICGAGEDDKVNARIAQLGLSGNVEMLGYRQDVYSVMAGCDLLILPSWHEGMPNVLLEAMCIGLPCIVSRIPAHTELFKDEKVVRYFSPANMLELSNILSEAVDGDLDLEQMSYNGMIFAGRFSPTKLAERYFEFYRRLG